MSYLQAMARFYMARQKFSQAGDIAKQMIMANPENPLGQQLLDFISGNVQE
jgi:hypothetical protein